VNFLVCLFKKSLILHISFKRIKTFFSGGTFTSTSQCAQQFQRAAGPHSIVDIAVPLISL